MWLRCAVTDVDLTLIRLVVDIYHINLPGVSLSQFPLTFLLCPRSSFLSRMSQFLTLLKYQQCLRSIVNTKLNLVKICQQYNEAFQTQGSRYPRHSKQGKMQSSYGKTYTIIYFLKFYVSNFTFCISSLPSKNIKSKHTHAPKT